MRIEAPSAIYDAKSCENKTKDVIVRKTVIIALFPLILVSLACSGPTEYYAPYPSDMVSSAKKQTAKPKKATPKQSTKIPLPGGRILLVYGESLIPPFPNNPRVSDFYFNVVTKFAASVETGLKKFGGFSVQTHVIRDKNEDHLRVLEQLIGNRKFEGIVTIGTEHKNNQAENSVGIYAKLLSIGEPTEVQNGIGKHELKEIDTMRFRLLDGESKQFSKTPISTMGTVSAAGIAGHIVGLQQKRNKAAQGR